MNVNDLLVELDKRDTLLANDAASKIRELIKENERLAEVEKDAARYRWLRKHDGSLTYKDVRCFVERPMGPCTPELKEVDGKKLDAAIDAAMKEQP